MDETLVGLLERNLEHADAFEGKFDGLRDAQRPDVVTVCCSDSRVMQDHMWGNDSPGEIFTCSNIGNRVVQQTASGEAVSGDVLYPLVNTGTRMAIVVGHTGCGAVTATYDALTNGGSHPPGIEHCLSLLKPRLADGVESLPADLTHEEAVNRLVECNVDEQVAFLRGSDDVPEDVTVVGAVYDFHGAYGGRAGEISVVNVDGESDPETLKERHPDIASRVGRLWAN